MSRNIKNVFVNGISLVSSKHTPAVEQAETGFALFKTVLNTKIDLSKTEKILANLNVFSLIKIQKNLEMKK